MRFVCESCSAPFATEDRTQAVRCPRCGGLLRPDGRGVSAEAVRAVESILDWYVAVDDEPVGPLAASALRARWEAGQIGADTLAWRPGLADWQPIAELRELHEVLRASARPPPAPPAWIPAVAPAAAPEAAPRAGSLSALAGAELSGRVATPGTHRLDALTASTQGPHRSSATALPASRPAAPPEPRRWTAVGAAAFVLGAAAAGAVALVVFDRERPRPAAAATRTEGVEPQRAAPAAAAIHDDAVARAEVTPAAPVRASDPPAAPAQAAAPPSVAAPAAAPAAPVAAPVAPPRPAVAVRAEPPRAATKPPPRRAARDAVRLEPRKKDARVAMAPRAERPAARAAPDLPPATSEKPAGPAAPTTSPPPRKGTTGDPLLDTVTDDELERELGGAAAPARPASKAASTVYVPPPPGGGESSRARAAADLPEAVSPAQINDAVSARLSALRGCIDEQRTAEPSAKGTLKMRWVIGGDGAVREVKSLSGEYDGQPISRCIAGVVKGIRFPASRTRGQEVIFPFKF